MRKTRWTGLALLALASLVQAGAAWHHELAFPGGGTWRMRATVTVRNRSGNDVMGRAATVRIGNGKGELNFVGQRAAALRVCNATGAELLYNLTTADGEPKREGTLKAGDRLSFGVEVPDGKQALYYAYADNPDAWPVVEFLHSGATFGNGGFEAGEDGPVRWEKALETTDHRLAWVTENPHGGKRCVRCVVGDGAEATWVKWMQGGIAIEPDADYRLEGWVRTRDVKGHAAYYIHVHGKEPMALNKSTGHVAGTSDWTRVEVSFHTPPDAVRANIGTILRGTGAAWYDDVKLVLLSKSKPLTAEAGKPEEFRLAELPAPRAWRVEAAGFRVPLRVRNWADRHVRPIVQTETAPLTRRLPPEARAAAQFRVLEPATGKQVSSFQASGRLLFEADLPRASERTYHAYIETGEPAPDAAEGRRYADLVASEANLLTNPGYETGEELPADWRLSAQTDLPPEKLHRGSRDREAHTGQWCARLDIPPEAPLAWSGWHQDVAVKPSTTYLFGAWLRSKNVDGSVQLHGHWHQADGARTEDNAFTGVGPGLSGTQDWTLLLGTVQSPADAATMKLHLTMNAHGTVWHDDALFCEAASAIVGDVEAQRPFDDPVARRRGYGAWLVNPVVKVFPNDLPRSAPSRIELAAARNEYEPVQLVLRAADALEQIAVTVRPPQHKSGAALDNITINRVGYVPVDHPTNYYRSKSPTWYRKRPPRGRTGCDGWAGQWPDPLPPCTPFDLEPGTNQPIWITLRVPEDAPAGPYQGRVTIQPKNAPALELPLAVRVWDFALPPRPSLKVVYDMRERYCFMFGGASGTRDQVLDRWHRFLAERRISPGLLPSPKFRYQDGEVTMEAADFDRHASVCLDELDASIIYSPWFLYAFGWAREPRHIFGLEPFTEEYTSAYQQCLSLYTAHLRKKGWYDRMILYVSDEPHFYREGITEQMIKVCQMIREVEPDIPIYSSTWRHVPEWHGHINLWGAGHYGCFPVETLRGRQKAGDQILFTTDGQQCLDTPYCAVERLLPWYCWKYDAIGYEFWGVNWWTYNPWERGWHRYIRQSSDGVKFFYVRYPNGDGYLTYPGGPVGVDGPVSSVRLEQAREGIEDYEYFRILDRLIAEAKTRGLDTAEADAARAQALALVDIPNRGGRYSTSILPEPDAVPTRRQAVGKAIESLTRRLR
jgi:hypothetical protein